MAFNSEKVILGTHATIKLNGELVAEATGLEAKVTIKKEEVKMLGDIHTRYKIVGLEGKGTLKLNKVYSRFIDLLSDDMKDGKDTVCTIESLLADPKSDGTEGILLKDCIFDELTLADFEAGKIGDRSYPFTFSDWEVNETIDVPTP